MAHATLSQEARRELAIDTIASWALEGMHPTPQTLANIEAYLAGELSRDEFIAKYTAPE